MKSPTSSSQTLSPSIMSMDVVLGMHFFEALKELQNTWLGYEKPNEIMFSIQFEYIVRLIPDENIQEKIQKERTELESKYYNEPYPKIRAGLVVVTEIVKFMCTAFDLMHVDIIGPATGKSYRDRDIDISDMPEELKPKEKQQEAKPSLQIPISPELLS